MMNQPISSIMTHDVVSISPKQNLSAARDLIFEKHFHHLPVVEDGRLMGIITSFDLMKLDLKFEEYDKFIVEEVMTKRVVTLEPKEKIGAAAQIFLRHLFHGLPIVDENRNLLGIVTTHDILKQQFDLAYPDDELEKAFRVNSSV